MDNETVFYQVGNTAITNTRFAIGGQTFAIQKIASVRGVEIPPRYGGLIAGIISGLIISFIGFPISGFGFIIGTLGILILALSIFQLARQKKVFSIVLGIGGSEVTAYRSMNRNIVDKIIQALNQAIISRG